MILNGKHTLRNSRAAPDRSPETILGGEAHSAGLFDVTPHVAGRQPAIRVEVELADWATSPAHSFAATPQMSGPVNPGPARGFCA